MRLTNTTNLPQPIVDAIANDPYDPGRADISVTSLIDSPQIRRLSREYSADLSEDVSERVWALFGQAVHAVLERADSSAITEARLYMKVPVEDVTTGKHPRGADNFIISGAMDRLYVHLDPEGEGVTIQDWKVMSRWEHIYGLKPDRETQLNLYRQLVELNHPELPVRRLQVGAFYRDWNIGDYEKALKQAGYDTAKMQYPQAQVHMHEVPIWSTTKTYTYVKNQLARHFPEHDTLQQCTVDETWMQPGRVAVVKPGRKTALRVLDDEHEARAWIEKQKNPDELLLEHRPPVYNRCRMRLNGHTYCPVAAVCPQWAAVRKANGWDRYGKGAGNDE